MANPNLPEGTDHIVEGAGAGPDDDRFDDAAGGRIGEETLFTPDEDPEENETGTARDGAASGGKAGGGADGGNLFEALGNWQTVGTDRAREFAQAGLDRATAGLDDVVKMIHDAADQIDDKVGEQYGQYARRAADSLGGFGEQFRGKDVDALFADARDLVKKSPGIAIGAAAALGFVVARLARAGVDAAGSVAEEAARGVAPKGGKAA